MNAPIAKPDYGNWVSTRLIYAPGALGLVCLGLALLAPAWAIPAVLFLAIAGYFGYARSLFSPQGGNVQARIRELVLAHLDWDGQGKALDIGCGNGALAIGVACKYPQVQVTGIDYWGGNWEYSQSVCEKNALLEGVAGRTTFQKASAAALPFEDGEFDAVVSNLVFHEVSAVKDKRELVREALRVLKPGGKFSFQDLFFIKPAYGEAGELVKTVESWGVRQVAFVETRHSFFIPPALKLPFMVGTIALMCGEK